MTLEHPKSGRTKFFLSETAQRAHREKLKNIQEELAGVFDRCVTAVDASNLPSEHKNILLADLRRMQQTYTDSDWEMHPKSVVDIAESVVRDHRLDATWGEGRH